MLVHTFSSDINDFKYRTRRRLVVKLVIVTGVAVFLLSPWSVAIPEWIDVVVLALALSSLLFELIFFKKAKRLSETFSISLGDDFLVFSYNSESRSISYRDLKILKVIKKKDRIEEVLLKTRFGQTIRLRGMRNMDLLYGELENKMRNSDNRISEQ